MLVLLLVILSVHGQEIDQDEKTMTAVMARLDVLAKTIDMVQDENAALKQEIQELRRSKLLSGPICFSAVKTSDQNAAVGENILFDEELVDTHDAYNATYGIYVVPEDGLYEVIVTLFKGDATSYNIAAGDLYVGETFLTRIYYHLYSDPSASAHGTSSIIRQFQAGDVLHVVCAISRLFYGNANDKASQFSAKYLGPAL